MMGKVNIRKKDFRLFFRNFFSITIAEILFILACLLPVALYAVYAGIFNYGSEFSVLVFQAAFMASLLIASIIYKKKRSEFQLWSALAKVFFIMALISMFLASQVHFSSGNYIIYMLGITLGVFSSLLQSLLVLLGFAYFLFMKNKSMKEFILLYIASILISALSTLHSYYLQQPSRILSLGLLITALGNLFIFYSFRRIAKFARNKALFFFAVFGLIIFLIEYANGLLLEYSLPYDAVNHDMLGLFLLNFGIFIYYMMWGFLVGIYNQEKPLAKKKSFQIRKT